MNQFSTTANARAPSLPLTNEQHRQAAAIQRWLLLLYVAFVVYGSLVPFHFVYRPLDDALAAFQNIRLIELGIGSRADLVANLILFVPLTFLASLVFGSGTRGVTRVLVSGLLLLAAVLLATGIEFTQLYFAGRTVGQNDIFAESAGAMVGIVCYWRFGIGVQTWLASFWHSEMRQGRVTHLLHAYLVVFFVLSVLPLDLTLSPIELYRKWNQDRIILIPFIGIKGGLAQSIYKYATDLIIWIPVGLLWSMQRATSLRSVIVRGFCAGLVIESMQLFVYSRVTSVTDVLLAGAGTGVGHGIFQVTGRYLVALTRISARIWWALWLVWLVAILGVFWFPFNMDPTRLTASSALAAFTRLPFTSYYLTSEYHALTELLRKVGFFLPGGLLLGLFARTRASSNKPRSSLFGWTICLVAVLVEAGQLMIPDKVADLTDALLETAGGGLGYLIGAWVGKPDVSAVPAAPITPRPRRSHHPTGFNAHLIWIVLLTIGIGVVTTLPGMPYNVRKLIAPGATGMVTILGLALAIYWIASGAFLILPKDRRPRFLFLAFPVALVVHAIVAWCLLRVSTPNESFLKIVGTPVLGWAWEFEPLARYIALHVSVVTQMLGAILCVRAFMQPQMLVNFVYWLMVSLVLAWPLHLIVVDGAATDNLVELMRDNASFLASSSLAGAVFLTCLTSSSIAAALGAGLRPRWLFGIAFFAALGATGLFWLGLEPTLVKYDRVFSAFQFLLSEDREHYARGTALALRYVLAFVGFAGGLALLQWPHWRRPAHTLAGRASG